MATEEPRFDLIKKEDDFELRRYQAMIIAEVQVTGTLSEASNQGFRQVADFIFGNNEDPVKKKSEKIDMTAPVTIEENNAKENNGQTWKLAFVMPQKFLRPAVYFRYQTVTK